MCEVVLFAGENNSVVRAVPSFRALSVDFTLYISHSSEYSSRTSTTRMYPAHPSPNCTMKGGGVVR